MYKDLLIRFILGGAAVMVSYMITVISPWKILAGIFAAFPAVMITAVLMVGIASGSKKAAKIANGSVFGMIGGVVCVATVWAVLQVSANWALSIVLGLVFWLGSSIIVSTLRDKLKNSVRVNILSDILVRHK
ncbi:DUF3147 family protein [Bacillus sp. 7884-1]|jgi:hypothetical protein|uniref:DUF3147 family protein n=1 Tax=Bacillus sp. 7884-1 TaxID=2021693 RepID=UPI000BA58EDA|nr:DUF3147 family protein [Bacillus sp. 7884-1]PAE32013.1 hypothetical protein CHI06_27200 [Bacillus sp. 7884-1]